MSHNTTMASICPTVSTPPRKTSSISAFDPLSPNCVAAMTEPPSLVEQAMASCTYNKQVKQELRELASEMSSSSSPKKEKVESSPKTPNRRTNPLSRFFRRPALHQRSVSESNVVVVINNKPTTPKPKTIHQRAVTLPNTTSSQDSTESSNTTTQIDDPILMELYNMPNLIPVPRRADVLLQLRLAQFLSKKPSYSLDLLLLNQSRAQMESSSSGINLDDTTSQSLTALLDCGAWSQIHLYHQQGDDRVLIVESDASLLVILHGPGTSCDWQIVYAKLRTLRQLPSHCWLDVVFCGHHTVGPVLAASNFKEWRTSVLVSQLPVTNVDCTTVPLVRLVYDLTPGPGHVLELIDNTVRAWAQAPKRRLSPIRLHHSRVRTLDEYIEGVERTQQWCRSFGTTNHELL